MRSRIVGEMRWKGSQTESAKQSHVAGKSRLQVMQAIEKAFQKVFLKGMTSSKRR